MTDNVKVEEVRVKKLSIDEAKGGTKLFNLTLGQILRDSDVNGSKANKKVVYKDITKENKTLIEEKNYDTKLKSYRSQRAEVR